MLHIYICKVKAISGHQAADCVIPFFFRYILKNNKAFAKEMDPCLINSLMMEFGLQVKLTNPPDILAASKKN